MALVGASVGWMFFADHVSDRNKLCAGLVPLEYSIEQLTCAVASRLDAGMVG